MSVIDDTDYLGQRLKELEAEKELARTGTSAPVTGQEPKAEDIQAIAKTWHGWTYSQQADSYNVDGCI